jgi:hypothetical protein
MNVFRNRMKRISNNKKNPNKNICTLAVAKHLGVGKVTTYLHTTCDVVRAARTKYTVRSRQSKINGLGIGQARERLALIAKMQTEKVKGFIVYVNGHILFLNKHGKTVVDTDPRLKADKRKIKGCYIVYK